MQELELLAKNIIYKNIPLYISWKNTDLIYLGANDYFVKNVGLNSAFDIIGKKDSELPWAEDAESLEQADRLVLQGNSLLNIRGSRWHPEGSRTLILNAVPLKDATGTIIGILYMHQDLAQNVVDVLPEKENPVSMSSMRDELQTYLKKAMNNQLTDREIECLSLWLGGHSIKESAFCLYISHKSIEAYRKHIKDKLCVNHRSQLIERMQKSGTFELFLSLAKLIQEQSKNLVA